MTKKLQKRPLIKCHYHTFFSVKDHERILWLYLVSRHTILERYLLADLILCL
ncbi:hypothetical protein HD_0554 [[Haemophilus] ducreyi 35000HP]|uniref:Uncharacterized protein n=1 Tax=Haemophilus ducreyi (strain 35000HP / ATCC 700724) TaxID=233412 RepID=Q7VNI0_HAEDU|nr:hypothetical protein HD_0554 [[Haemophilus] ducreyi 35000HP]